MFKICDIYRKILLGNNKWNELNSQMDTTLRNKGNMVDGLLFDCHLHKKTCNHQHKIYRFVKFEHLYDTGNINSINLKTLRYSWYNTMMFCFCTMFAAMRIAKRYFEKCVMTLCNSMIQWNNRLSYQLLHCKFVYHYIKRVYVQAYVHSCLHTLLELHTKYILF